MLCMTCGLKDAETDGLLCGDCRDTIDMGLCDTSDDAKVVFNCVTDESGTETKTLEFELNVPSGTLVVANDLRPIFAVAGDWDINTDAGCAQKSLAMAAIGCAHGFVGNTCPGVYQIDGRRLTIAIPGWLDDNTEVEPDGDRVASICTDLWWYSIVDLNEFKRRTGERTLAAWEAETVDVEPGVYRFRHMYDADGQNDVAQTFTEIEWIRGPDLVFRLQTNRGLTSQHDETGKS